MEHALVQPFDNLGLFCERHAITRTEVFLLNPQLAETVAFLVDGTPTAYLQPGQLLRIYAADGEVPKHFIGPINPDGLKQVVACAKAGGWMVKDHGCGKIDKSSPPKLVFADGTTQEISSEELAAMESMNACIVAGGMPDLLDTTSCRPIVELNGLLYADTSKTLGAGGTTGGTTEGEEEKKEGYSWGALALGAAAILGMSYLAVSAMAPSPAEARASNPIIPKDEAYSIWIAREYSDFPALQSRIRMAADPRVSPIDLETLALDENWEVRAEVAKNPNTMEHTLWILVPDRYEVVSDLARERLPKLYRRHHWYDSEGETRCAQCGVLHSTWSRKIANGPMSAAGCPYQFKSS